MPCSINIMTSGEKKPRFKAKPNQRKKITNRQTNKKNQKNPKHPQTNPTQSRKKSS